MIKTAEILCVGTELLLGEVINTNAAYISKKLAEFGVSVFHHAVVGDNPERLKVALDLALSRSDLVVMSGGLGPPLTTSQKRRWQQNSVCLCTPTRPLLKILKNSLQAAETAFAR